MEYKNIVVGKFIERPNRFIARVLIEDKVETVHVKNTGRCRELLLPNVDVILEKSDNPERKTAYDLVTVKKDNIGWINIDSQAPNKIVREWLDTLDFDYIKPEFTYGDSRVDFYMEKGTDRYLMEVKGCTLEIDGVGFFPDAPTERGVKHLRELARACKEGYKCFLTFAIQMEGIEEVRPHEAMHPEFAVALREAEEAGVEVVFLCCRVSEKSVEWTKAICQP